MTDNDPITRADLTRELHLMETQVEQHGFPGTRAVLAELERLRTENARLRAAAGDALSACLPLLPLEGAWPNYKVSKRVSPTLQALPEEWAEAAHAVAALGPLLDAR